MIDIILLRLIKYRHNFFKLKDIIPLTNLTPQTTQIVEDFHKYFIDYPSHKQIDLLTFMPRFRNWHPGMTDEMFTSYTNIFRNIAPDADEDQERNIMSDLSGIELATKMANVAQSYSDGDMTEDLYSIVVNLMDKYRMRRGLKATTWIDTDIGELLQEEFDDSGIRWRLGCLNMSTRPLRPGDFIVVAGRPDKGKTSLITSEITFMAPQLPKDRNVLWLNNEGPGKRIKPRLYQSALGLSMSEMKQRYVAGTLKDDYNKAVGREDKIRIIDIHGQNVGQVETLIEENNPGIIVYDMIDNIRGFGEAARTDLQLEEMYKWARERSVKFDCIGIATSQISNDGDGQDYPTLGMLKDSKTGKQGACDALIMIGARNDVAFAGSRFIGMPKNKIRRPEGPSDPRTEVLFDGLRARYSDIAIGA